MADQDKIRKHIFKTVMTRLDQDKDRRVEALKEYMAVTMTASSDQTADKLADMIPDLLPELYEKWVGMFVDRLFETVPQNQLELISDGSEDNKAAIILAYLMFLESERMEKQVDEDLRSYGLTHSGDQDMGGVAADYIRARMGNLADEVNKKQ